MHKILLNFFLIIFSLKIYSQSELTKKVNFSKSPVDIFNESCSGCHGEEGSAYGKNFAVMSDDSLREIIKEMMYGPAQLTPSDEDIKAMTAYNKSISSNKPFAIIMNSETFLHGKEDHLLISLSPNTKLNVNDKKVKIKTMGNHCELSYSPKNINKLKITITRDNRFISFSFPEQLWTK